MDPFLACAGDGELHVCFWSVQIRSWLNLGCPTNIWETILWEALACCITLHSFVGSKPAQLPVLGNVDLIVANLFLMITWVCWSLKCSETYRSFCPLVMEKKNNHNQTSNNWLIRSHPVGQLYCTVTRRTDTTLKEVTTNGSHWTKQGLFMHCVGMCPVLQSSYFYCFLFNWCLSCFILGGFYFLIPLSDYNYLSMI